MQSTKVQSVVKHQGAVENCQRPGLGVLGRGGLRPGFIQGSQGFGTRFCCGQGRAVGGAAEGRWPGQARGEGVSGRGDKSGSLIQ